MKFPRCGLCVELGRTVSRALSGVHTQVSSVTSRTFNGRILREGLWVTVGQLLSALAALLAIRVLTGLLSPAEYGELALLLGVAALALGFAVRPVLQGVMRYFPDWSRKGHVGRLRVVGLRMTRRSVIATAMVVIVVAGVTDQIHGLGMAAGILIAGLLAVDAARIFEISMFNSARRQRPTAFLYAADAVARPVGAIAGIALLGASAAGAAAGYIAASVCVLVILYAATTPEGGGCNSKGFDGPLSDPDAEALRIAILRYAKPLPPLAVCAWVSGVGDRYLLGSLLDLHAVGFYAAAYGLVSRPFLMLSSMIELTLRPILQDAVAKGDAPRADRAKRAWICCSVVGTFSGAVLFALLSDPIAELLLSETYWEAAVLMPWIASGAALYSISLVYSRFCYVYNDTKSVLMIDFVGATASVALMVPAITWYGLIGAAVAVPFYFGIQLLMSMMLARRAERVFETDSFSMANRLGTAQ